MRLPLGILAGEEALEDADNLLEGGEVDTELSGDLVLVGAELGVKVLAVGAGAHGGAEDGLDEEAVVGLEGGGVGVAEGLRELLGLLGDVLAQGDAGELEATNQPEETLGGNVLLGGQLGLDELLKGGGLAGSSQLALADFLDVAAHVALDGTESNASKGIEDGGQRLRGIEEVGGRDGILLVGVRLDIDKGLLEGVEVGSSGGDLSGHGV